MFDENENRDEITREEPGEKAEETVELSGEEDTAEKPEPEDIYSSSETNREYTNVYSSVADADDDDDIDIYSSDEPGVKYVDVEPDIPETAYTDAYSQPVNTAQNYQQPQYAQNPYSPYTERAYAPPIYGQPAPQPTGQYNPPVTPQEPVKKKKKGRKFLKFLALVLVFVLGVCAVPVAKKIKAKLTPSHVETYEDTDEEETSRGTGENKEIVISSNPGKEITNTAELAEKARKSNVGILLYTDNAASSLQGQGSGVVMDVDSTGEYTFIITCAHVIDSKGTKVKVQTEDGKSYDAEVVGYDTRTDLGVIRVHYTGFTPAEFGNSDDLVVGDPVYAIGNPGGVEFFGSFTGGFVSAINRPINSEIGYTMKCIQHDASINPGNSGGMLVNKYGQVIGINSQKISNTSYEGMGFAIPVSAAKPIIEDLITYGYVKDRPKLGISYYSVSSVTQYYMIAQMNNLPAGSLVITEVNEDSALAGTDVKRGDIIIGVNGKDLTTADVLLELIDKGKVGDKLTLKIARINSNYSVDTFDVTATLVEDRGTTAVKEETTQYDPFSYFGY